MRGKKLLLSGLCAVLVLSVMPRLKAQDSGGSGLSISPTVTPTLRINPGESDKFPISLRNVTGGDIIARAFINDFTSNNETGEPEINLDTTSQNPASIRPFLKGVEDVPLKRGEEKTFEITVDIPNEAAPGAYYGLVRYEAVPAGNNAPAPGQVSLTASVSTIVLIEVTGDIHEQVELKSVRLYRGDKAGSFFVSPPGQIGVEIENKGNSFAQPFGTVTVKNPFGKQSYSYELNDSTPRGNILPGSTRIFKDEIKGLSWPGVYQVTANVSFGNGGEVLTMQKSFWYLPAWFFVLLTILIGLAIYAVNRLQYRRKAVRRHKR